MKRLLLAGMTLVALTVAGGHAQQPAAPASAPAVKPLDPKAEARLTGFKTEAAAGVDDLHDYTQKMVDSVFSFGELGFQEIETSKYLTNILYFRSNLSFCFFLLFGQYCYCSRSSFSIG